MARVLKLDSQPTTLGPLFIGPLDGGYYVTDSAGDDYWELRAAADPTSVVGSVAIDGGSTRNLRPGWNANGAAYVIYNTAVGDTSYTLTSFSQTGGTLTAATISTAISTIGTPAFGDFAIGDVLVPATDTEVVVRAYGAGRMLGYDTSNGSATFDITFTGHTFAYPVGAASPGRTVVACNTHGLELWDTTAGTVLDTLTRSMPGGGYVGNQMMAVSDDRLLAAEVVNANVDPLPIEIGMLSTAGDVLSWEWTTNHTTNWSDNIYDVSKAAWSPIDTGVLIPFDDPFVSRDMSPVIVNLTTGVATNAAADAATKYGTQWYVYGAPFYGFCGPDWLVKDPWDLDNTAAVWTFLEAARKATYLRQRQSPVRAPSRVSWKVV